VGFDLKLKGLEGYFKIFLSLSEGFSLFIICER
jgi:hypothetical protein